MVKEKDKSLNIVELADSNLNIKDLTKKIIGEVTSVVLNSKVDSSFFKSKKSIFKNIKEKLF